MGRHATVSTTTVATLFAAAAEVLADSAADESAAQHPTESRSALLADICTLLQANDVSDLVGALAEIAAEAHSHASEHNVGASEPLRKATVLLSEAASALGGDQ